MDEERIPAAVELDAPTVDATEPVPVAQVPVAVDEVDSFAATDEQRYELQREIGRGGVGRVSEARDQRLERQVAIKQLLRHDRASRNRFLREAFLTARLQHPAIVPILDAGRSEDGDLFYAMPLVSGPSLAEVIGETKTLTDRLSLLPNVVAAVEAIAYAHHERVIHRDIKPHNIVIGSFGETFVVDWGLAKDLSEADDASSTTGDALANPKATVVGAVLGTPAFMAPEQARGEPADERTDVYGLGALLYHVLSGVAPYRGDTGAQVLAKLTAAPPTPLLERERNVPHDLVAIVAKAMARAPDDRYANAGELADDLKRFQTGQLVSAHDYSVGALVGRWLRRNKTTVAVAGLLLAVLVVVAAVSIRNVIQARDEADTQRDFAIRNGASAAEARAASEAARVDLLRGLVVSSLDSDPTAAMAWLKRYADESERWGQVRVLATAARTRGVARHVWTGHDGRRVNAVHFSPDGRSVASAGDDGGIRLWSVESGAYRDIAVDGARITGLAFTSAGLVSVDASGAVRVTDLADGTSRELLRQADTIRALILSATGSHFAVAGLSGRVSVHDLATGRTVHSTDRHEWFVQGLAFSPDGAQVASSAADNTVRVWDTRSGDGQVIGTMPNSVQSVAYSANGDYLIAACLEGTIHIWRTSDWKRVRALKYVGSAATVAAAPHGATLMWSAGADVYALTAIDAEPTLLVKADSLVEDLSFSPSGRFVAVSTRGGSVHMLDMHTDTLWHLRGHRGGVTSMSYSPDEQWLASASIDGTVRLWPTQAPDSETVWRHPGGVTIKFFDLSPDGRRLSIVTLDNTLRVWDREGVFEFPEPVLRTPAVFSSDSTRLGVLTRDGSVVVWDLDANTMRRHRAHRGAATLCNARLCQVRFSPNNATIASTYGGDYIAAWNLADDTHRRLQGSSQLHGFSFSDDSRRIISGAIDGSLTMWDLADDTRVETSSGAGNRAGARLVPNGEDVISRGPAGVIELWNPNTGQVRVLPATTATGWRFFFTNDGRHMATGNSDGTITVFDVATWSSRPLRSNSDAVQIIHFVDERFLLSWAGAPTLRMWHIDSGENATLRYDDVPLSILATDGETIATGDVQGRVRISRIATPAEPAALRVWLESVTSAVIEDDRPSSKLRAQPPSH